MKRSNDHSCERESADSSSTGRAGSQTSASLLDRVRGGEERAWSRLTRLYGSLVYSWCRQQDLQPADAADVVQDVFRGVAAHVERFEAAGREGSFRRWLKTITNNRIRDLWRSQQRRPQAEGGTDAQLRFVQEPAQAVDTADQERAEVNHVLRQALELVRADFEPATWQAFWQTVVDGRDTQDVAADLNMSPNAVRIARSRVRGRLRQEFDKLMD